MSYSIYIGQAELRPADPEDGDEGIIDVIVEPMSLGEAPEFPGDTLTGKGNGRHPSYSGWANFIDEAGLKDLFKDQDTGLMREHPGCFPLLTQHLIRVEAALEIWKTKHVRMPSRAGTPRRIHGRAIAPTPDTTGLGHVWSGCVFGLTGRSRTVHARPSTITEG